MAALVTVANLILTILQRRSDARNRLLEHREAALVTALQVIDHVYANESLGGPPSDPHEWDIQLARDADNQMRIYCGHAETRLSFYRALGLYNPLEGQAQGISIAALDEFRSQIAKELDLPPPVSDRSRTWISNLSGAGRRKKAD